MARNRVIYQSQALFISPSSTGAQVSGVSAAGNQTTGPWGPTDGNTGTLASGISLLKKLQRVQNINWNMTVNRQDINEFGILSRIDSIVTEAPTVGLDFSYYLTDGYNERLLGLNITGASDTNTANGAQAISGLLADLQGNNYYILTVDEGEDVVGGDLAATSSVIGIGNGFLTEYSFDASVGALPTASVKVEAFNIKTDANKAPLSVGTLGGALGGSIVTLTGTSPAVDLFAQPATKSTAISQAYKIDYSRNFTGAIGAGAGVNVTGWTTGVSTISALRPGDIVLTIPTNDGLSNLSQAHIQSFKFTIPLSRTVLKRLGNTFGFTRVINVPINMDLSISASLSELRDQNLFDLLATPVKRNFTITLNNDQGTPKMSFGISGAIFSSESTSHNLGDNESVDYTYKVQIGGSNDVVNGIFCSGSYSASTDDITNRFFKLGTGKLS
jgi:hypothetical protein